MSRITFITPTLNRDQRIVERCLRSVALQTVTDWDQVVCSDGRHEPAIERLVERLDDPRRTYMHLPRCAGHYGAGVRAAVIELARGEFVSFLDDDNMVFPRYGELMIDALDRNPDAAFAICQIVECRGNPKLTKVAPYIMTGVPPVLHNVDTLQYVVRTAAMRKTGYCQQGYSSDGYTVEKLAKEHSWVAVNDVLGMHL